MTRSEIMELSEDGIKRNLKTDKQAKERAYNFTTQAGEKNR